MRECNSRAGAPILVVNLPSIFRRNSTHDTLSFCAVLVCVRVTLSCDCCSSRDLRGGLRTRSGPHKPNLETCVSKLCAVVWHDAPLAQLSTEIFCVRVDPEQARAYTLNTETPSSLATVCTPEIVLTITRCGKVWSTDHKLACIHVTVVPSSVPFARVCGRVQARSLEVGCI